QGGLGLVWLEPWDGEGQLEPSRLDPYFIEVCRRVRLIQLDGEVVLRRIATKSSRIAAKELKGNLGDPWTPIRKKDGAAFTGKNHPLSYRKLHELLLSGEGAPGPALSLQPGDGASPVLMGQILSLGQSKSDGYHERTIPIAAAARPLLGSPEGVARLGRRSESWLVIVDAVQNKLRWAISALLGDAASSGELRAFIAGHDDVVDRTYFHRLFASLEEEAEVSDRAFAEFCIVTARSALEHAVESLPVPQARRYRVIAEAEGRFEGGLHTDKALRTFVAKPKREELEDDRVAN
ncbi:MAG TPA: hypothetical protein PKE00_09100, partial [Planctomycetota bacterium]|nr:hypothetical protein [Planctomycetota bacterium]